MRALNIYAGEFSVCSLVMGGCDNWHGRITLRGLRTVDFSRLIPQARLCRDCAEPRPVRRLRMSRRSG